MINTLIIKRVLTLWGTCLCVIITSNCAHRTRILSENVVKIDFYAMDKGIETSYSFKPEDVIRSGRDTVITDRLFIDEFVTLINSLKPVEEICSDNRAVAVIKTTVGEEIQIAFGYHWGIHLNGVRMNDDQRLFDFIDKYVYGPHEQVKYYWHPDEVREMMLYQDEFFKQLPSIYSE